MSAVRLRPVRESDVPLFFEHQADPESVRMAAVPSRDRDAFAAHWREVLAGETAIARTIEHDGEVAGFVASFERAGERLVGYWLDKAHWGRGVATAALSQLLREVTIRPLLAHVAKHNAGSIRVLEKCGFTIAREDVIPAGPDGEPVEEYVYVLDSENRS